MTKLTNAALEWAMQTYFSHLQHCSFAAEDLSVQSSWLKINGNPTQWTRKVDIRREAFFLMLGSAIVSSLLSSLVSSTLLLSTSAFGEKIIRSWFDSQKRKRRVRKSKWNEQFHSIHRRISFELINAVCKRRQLVLSLLGVKISKLKYHLIHFCRLITLILIQSWAQ